MAPLKFLRLEDDLTSGLKKMASCIQCLAKHTSYIPPPRIRPLLGTQTHT